MKKKLISLAILTLTVGVLIACNADSPTEPTPEPTHEPTPTLVVTEPPPTTEPDQEPVQELTPEPTTEPTPETIHDTEQSNNSEIIIGEWAQMGIVPGDEHLQANAVFLVDGIFRHQWGSSAERGTWTFYGDEIRVEVTHAGHSELGDALPLFEGDEDDRLRVFIFDSDADTLTEVYRGTTIVYARSS